ncbi:hypothetical protein GCM10009547_22410 [Sporichthya brevicatena]|uniref:Uncharacterized protein n=1 Tax=Sporichthya brevicatena TaxID=171442 RepID=A0ABP3RXT5_9ACTN
MAPPKSRIALVDWARVQWDRALGAGAVLLGAILLIVGWFKISDTGFVSEQLPYLASAGLGGVFLLGFGGMMWLSADLRDQWRELRGIRTRLDADPAPAAVPAAASAAPAADVTGRDHV